MSTVGVANVIVRPIVADFRQQVAQAVGREIGSATIPLPVTPAIPRGSTVTWEKLASGAAIPSVLPLPVQPTITPAAKAAFGAEIGGLRGLLLGGGQLTAARALGISTLAGGVFLFAKAAVGAVKSAATLEQELNVFEQVSGATADEMARVSEEARRLGADIRLPAVSAGDAAATMTDLAKAGLSVDEVLDGTRGTLQLATAANIDFASAAELSANALNSFQLPGTEAIRVADLLAGAANAAQGDISDFGQALAQAGAVANQAGLNVQETVTFLTELAKAGIQGSDAGTSLRVALLRLIAPTEEAKDIFRALGIEVNDAAGNVRVDVFEQLRRSMVDLSPATRNAALATIFGTDAIRSAAIFTREGARGFDEMQRQVSREGQAAEAADARTKGLLGSVSGLSSNLDTLGATLGGFVKGPLTDFTNEISGAVSDLNDFAHALDEAFHGDTGDLFDKIQEDFVLDDNIRKVNRELFDFGRGADRVQAKLAAALDAKVVDDFGDALERRRFDKRLPDAITETTGEDVRQRGLAVGQSFGKGIAEGITKEERGVIAAARRTVQDAQRSLAEVVAEGARAVEAAAVDAKQNLTSIGQGLGAQVLELLDSGPLAQRIEALQDRLDRSREGLERGSLRRSLRDAREELERAEQQVAQPRSAAERAGAERFLRPFRENVKDAQAALEEFNAQGTIDKLTARLQAQKERFQKIFDGLIAKFNAGLLSGTQVNAEVAALLQKNVGPMAKAGSAQGFAFKQGFAAQLASLQAQIAAITGGPQTKKTGAEPAIVSPADAAKTAAGNVAAAQRSVKDAIVNLQKANQEAVAGPDGTNDILRDIRRQLRAPASKPSADVKTPKKPVRTGPR